MAAVKSGEKVEVDILKAEVSALQDRRRHQDGSLGPTGERRSDPFTHGLPERPSA